MTQENLYDYEEASRLLGCAESTLRRWASLKRIRHLKIGSRVRFWASDLEEFLDQAEVAPAVIRGADR